MNNVNAFDKPSEDYKPMRIPPTSEDDLVAAGFHRLDPDLIEQRPPKIKWGMVYSGKVKDPETGEWWDDARRIVYLEKLAATMNHAAKLIQDERNVLLELIEKKANQLIAASEAVNRNNAMLQQQITEMNEKQQQFNTRVAELNTKIRELEAV